MRIKSLSHAGLTVCDFERSVAWYHERFGFFLVSEDRLGPEATEALFPLYGVEGASVRMGFLRAPGGGVIEIFEFEPKRASAPTAWNATGFTHAALNVSGVASWIKRLERRGVDFVVPVQHTGGVDWTFLRDPDGNLLELIDLKASRPALRLLGGLVGALLARGKFAGYYGSS
jgi:catechol 2,3-dioxygenase-like lactoylglutathione lyase family enzyme